ncbi:POTRA domain-containing protein [uncultured Allomuricauda sp.]|uniref:POTRA domain-containing protein n=1 Tax=Flagellimonas sp. 389 TaxID=2835862 RepID=UPI0028BED632|nr:POTRA domain-containing protein [uncultured Allomuricauda sp.]
MIQKLCLFLFITLTGLSVAGQTKRITKIVIQGNEKTKSSFLEKVIQLKLGTELDSAQIDEDIYRLKRLPSIAHAYFQVADDEIEGCTVTYGVEENFTLIPFANVYTSNNDEFAYRIGLQEFNALGQNITLGGFYQKDIFDSYGANIRAPYILGRKLGLAFSYQNLTTQEPVFLDNGTADYRYNNESVELLALYQLNFKNRFEFGINFFTEDYQYLFGSTDPSVPQDLKVNKHLFKLIYNYDGLRYHYQYLEGFRSVLNLQYVGSTNTQLPPFWIGFNDFSYFKRIGSKGNWATRLRLGISSNLDTPFAPFAVDNNLNIRGVGNLIDRGTAAIVLNTEYRHTLYEKDWFVLQGNVFMDGGSWRNPGGDFGDFGDKQNLRIYPGLGIRFIHKKIFNAIFRIDYGHGVTKEAAKGVVFGIGQYF